MTNEFLRNDHPVKIIVGGIEYPSVEHAFQASKTADADEKKKIASGSARDAKRLGRTVSIPVDWDERRLSVMEALVRQKFFSNDELRDKLIETGEEVIEIERRGDNFWGIDADGNGDNHLGKIIMKVRDEAQYIYGWDQKDEDCAGSVADVYKRVDNLIAVLDPPIDFARWSACDAVDQFSVDESHRFDEKMRHLITAFRAVDLDKDEDAD